MSKKRRHKNRHSGGAFNKSKSGSTLYLMVHFPLICFWKIGITGVGAVNRAIGIDKAVFGMPIPIFIAWIPGAYFIEQALHAVCGLLNVRFYSGDGESEWFWFPCIVIALPVMLSIWGGWFWLVQWVTGIGIFDWFLSALAGVGLWFIGK